MNSKKIYKKRLLEAQRTTVWERWTTHEGLKLFLGTDNRIELIPGGPFEILFLLDNPLGEQGGEGNKILSFLPEEMLSFSWNAPPSIPEIRNHPHKTWVVVQLAEVDTTSTEITLTHLGWLDGEKWDETYAYFDRAWDIVMDNLVASFTQGDHPRG